jgi:hypothetical protein
MLFLISNFRRVLNIVFVLLGISPASEVMLDYVSYFGFRFRIFFSLCFLVYSSCFCFGIYFGFIIVIMVFHFVLIFIF